MKNKIAPPFRAAEFDIMYNEGISKTGDVLDLAVEHGIVGKAGAWFDYADAKIGQGREATKKYLKENPDVLKEIEQKVREKVAVEADGESSTKFRFSAKRFAAQRQKLGLSAGDMGTLLGVSGQTVYHWESGKTRPRQGQLAAIAALRKMGKREIQTELETREG